MRRSLQKGTFAAKFSFLTGVVVLLLGMLSFESTTTSTARANRYIGDGKCKSCHKSEASGNQFGAWQKAKHSNAYDVLATPEAKALAAKKGIADPQKSDQCLKCHVTAFGQPKENIRKGFKMEHGVQCESCHGPGEQHLKARFAAAAAADAQEGGEEPPPYTKIPEGEIIKDVPMATCLGCHNAESPSFKPFCFHERMQEIRHLNPLKPRTAEELAALLVCGCADPCPCVDGCEEGKCGVPPKKDGK